MRVNRKRRRVAASYRMDRLEPRLLLATTSWLAGIDGSWNEPARWSAGVPGNFDTAIIAAAGTYVVTVPNGTFSVTSLTFGGTGSTPILRIAGGESGAGSLTVSNGFTNNGTIELTNSVSGQASTLNISAGALTNTVAAQITILPGAGGGTRTLGALLDNQGTLTLEHPLTLNKSFVEHTNSGMIDLNGGT